MLYHSRFPTNSLRLLKSVERFQHPGGLPLKQGDFIRLNSGGPIMMVVDRGQNGITGAWRERNGRAQESFSPRAAVHRVFPEQAQ